MVRADTNHGGGLINMHGSWDMNHDVKFSQLYVCTGHLNPMARMPV